MPRKGKVRCTWFENGYRCALPPVEAHHDARGELWAFLCIAHSYELQKVTKSGTAAEIRSAIKKAQGRKR